jgi:hypothetical protein
MIARSVKTYSELVDGFGQRIRGLFLIDEHDDGWLGAIGEETLQLTSNSAILVKY